MRAAAIALIIASILSTPACVGSTIHGLDKAEWMALLASGAALPIKSGDGIDYDAIARLGPGAILFVAMRAQDGGDDALAMAMLREAARREKGRYRRRAAELLGDALLAAGDGPGLVDLCESDIGKELTAYRRAYLWAVGSSRVGSFAEAAKAIAAMRSAYPTESSRDTPELSPMSLEARLMSGDDRWKDDFAAIAAMDGSTRSYAAMARAVAAVMALGGDASEHAIATVGARAFALAQARALAGAREYGQAVVAFRLWVLLADRLEAADAATAFDAATVAMSPLSPEAIAELFRTLPRSAASDAARSFISASSEEGAAGFALLVESSAVSAPGRAYFDLFWHGRFLRARESWDEASLAFSKALSLAASAADRDAAAWYAIEAASKRSTDEAIASLGKALSASKNPGYYSDIIEAISREALIARNGLALVALDSAIMNKATAKDISRLSYLCARAAQIGIISGTDIEAAFGKAFPSAPQYIETRLRIAYEQRSDGWYRLAAAYRLGESLVDPLSTEPPPAEESAQPPSAPAAAAPAVGPEEYALALARFGLGDRLRAELGAEYSALSPSTIRAVAESLRDAGRYDQALRIIATLYWRRGFNPARRDAELYWPRPYADEFAKASAEFGVEPSLLYGLARSESAFNPSVVSKSGAIGLTQLMPATALEMAGRLNIADYSLTDPEENLTIGAAYFARVLNAVDGRVLPAAFSYNGGPTRFRRWEAEHGDLPADLALEALSYAETRQYGRNVATAALSYAALYGEADLRDYFGYLLGEGPRP